MSDKPMPNSRGEYTITPENMHEFMPMLSPEGAAEIARQIMAEKADIASEPRRVRWSRSLGQIFRFNKWNARPGLGCRPDRRRRGARGLSPLRTTPSGTQDLEPAQCRFAVTARIAAQIYS